MRLNGRSRYFLALVFLLGLLVSYEAYANVRFYLDLRDGRDLLSLVEERVSLDELNGSREDALRTLSDFEEAERLFEAASGHLSRDPLLHAVRLVPFAGRQVRGLDVLVDLGVESTQVGSSAAGVLLAYAEYDGIEGETSIQSGLSFLEAQSAAMAELDRQLSALLESRRRLPGGLIGPLASAAESFDSATLRLADLVEGYERAYRTLPGLLGRDGPRNYLVLPQNDAELLPSGGLISSYAVVTFDNARLTGIELEYFGTLFDRWQRDSGGEYIEPPGPLKSYLKKDFSWGLGEAGWFPDFPTTAELARMFVEKGGVPPTDGVIAIDQQFVQGLLDVLGPVDVPAYGVVITPENLVETTLELTRDDQYEAGTPKKAFLSDLAQALLDAVFSAPKEKWVSLLTLFDDMADQRHLQLHFQDPALQALIVEYGFDGGVVHPEGDYVMLVDASVNSTKLNIVLETSAALEVEIHEDGTATSTVSYEIHNPFDEWRQGRDPELVRKLMLQGVYGSYTRVYAPIGSKLLDVRLNDEVVGAEQIGEELGKQSFGRFFPTLPGETNQLSMTYRTPVVLLAAGEVFVYRLYIQKEAGMRSIPLTLGVTLPGGAKLLGAWLDGEDVAGLASIGSDLERDRVLEVHFQLVAGGGRAESN